MWEHSIERFTKYNKVSTLYYYLHEYSYGRMITFMFKSVSKKTRMIGFQHGPSSMRKMVYMAAKKELSTDGDGIKTFPVPDEILSEDVFSKYIYTKAGYKNVEIMKKIYRLSYLNKVNRTKYNPDSVLIAPGLHDGKFLLNNLHALILKDKDTKYILKPHPRANNGYIDSFLHINNLTITNDKVLPLLSMVGKVYATYSSVAIEAHLLGIDIEIVEMPGKINESPLIDASFLKSAKNIRY